MNLVWKFNAALLAIFIVGFALASYVSYQVLQDNAREEVLQHARIMMEAASSSRTYTNNQVKPLLETQLKYRFLPQSVPAFAATEQFNDMRKKYPDYSYKEATLNPTNPRDHAADWEVDVINAFKATPTKLESFGVRETPEGRSMYLARPIQIKDPACIVCHSTPDAAPKTMIETYGTANGFGWKVNDIIGAQVVSVPIAVPLARANYVFKIFLRVAGRDIHFHHHHAQRDAVLVRHPARQAPGEARRRSQSRQSRCGRLSHAQPRRNRHPDRGAGTDEDEHGAGDQDARGLVVGSSMARKPIPDPTNIGKYRIDSVLGKGAMGVVYKAFDPGIERAVAIKTVRKDLVDPDLVEQSMARFKNEARAAGRLLHPNIVSVYEYGEDDDNAFIVMEYVEGTGLREFMNNGASFDLAQVSTIMTQLLLALDFAHERGVIHRDIKPANLILTASGTLKVADFGIARIDTSSLTSLGMVMGTPSYMSPEQCQGLVVDRRSDLFSAGVVFYELVAGEKPFSGALETIAYKICHEDPRPPSTVSRLPLTPTIDAVVATALEKNPEMRFQNAKALARALRQACEAGAEVTDDPYGRDANQHGSGEDGARGGRSRPGTIPCCELSSGNSRATSARWRSSSCAVRPTRPMTWTSSTTSLPRTSAIPRAARNSSTKATRPRAPRVASSYPVRPPDSALAPTRCCSSRPSSIRPPAAWRRIWGRSRASSPTARRKRLRRRTSSCTSSPITSALRIAAPSCAKSASTTSRASRQSRLKLSCAPTVTATHFAREATGATSAR